MPNYLTQQSELQQTLKKKNPDDYDIKEDDPSWAERQEWNHREMKGRAYFCNGKHGCKGEGDYCDLDDKDFS